MKTTSPKRLLQNTGSETDEECNGDHWSETSGRLANLEAKMYTMLDLFSEIATLKDRLKTIEGENKEPKKGCGKREGRTTRTKTQRGDLCMQQAQETEEVRELRKEMEKITLRETEDLVRNTMEEKLGITREDMNEIQFERLNRLSTRQNPQTRTKPRPIIAKFRFYQDKEYAMSEVKILKGTRIGTPHDYLREIDVIHEKQYPVLNKAKQGKQSAFFSKWTI